MWSLAYGLLGSANTYNTRVAVADQMKTREVKNACQGSICTQPYGHLHIISLSFDYDALEYLTYSMEHGTLCLVIPAG